MVCFSAATHGDASRRTSVGGCPTPNDPPSLAGCPRLVSLGLASNIRSPPRLLLPPRTNPSPGSQRVWNTSVIRRSTRHRSSRTLTGSGPIKPPVRHKTHRIVFQQSRGDLPVGRKFSVSSGLNRTSCRLPLCAGQKPSPGDRTLIHFALNRFAHLAVRRVTRPVGTCSLVSSLPCDDSVVRKKNAPGLGALNLSLGKPLRR